MKQTQFSEWYRGLVLGAGGHDAFTESRKDTKPVKKKRKRRKSNE